MRAYFIGGEQDGKVHDILDGREVWQFYMKPPELIRPCAFGSDACDISIKIQEYRRDYSYRNQLVYKLIK